MDKTTLGLGAAIIAAFFFGASNPYAKIAASQTDPVLLSFLVTAIAAVIFGLYALLNPKHFTGLTSKNGDLYLCLGIFGHAIPSLLSLYGLTMTSALNLLFLLRTEIFFATIFGVLIYKEAITLKQITGIIIGFLGVFLFATELKFTGVNLGDLLIILATVFWASYVVIVRKLSGTLQPAAIASIRAWVALPFLGAAALFLKTPITIPAAQYGNIGIFAISTYVFGVVAYNNAIERLGIWKAAIPAQLLSIIFGFIATWIVLGETLSSIKIIGAAMIALGTLLAVMKENNNGKN
ncbi:MAG TPA: DMT family transporter [Candidatus Norongarragalinales archaeon]|nr:DMT family transporter [Candidatus Norongarragalinales archaeon]